MTTILYVNHAHTKVCGIHDLGTRHWRRLTTSKHFSIAYAECGSMADYFGALGRYEPDAVIINYRADLMPWVSAALHSMRRTTFAVLHNYSPDSLRSVAAQHTAIGFDHLLVLDPSLNVSAPRVHVTGRAIPVGASLKHLVRDRPVVGSFGFAFPHKNFEAVAAEIDKTFDEAIFALHMPEAYFNGAQGAPLYTDGILERCRMALTKPGNELVFSDAHLAEHQLVELLSTNDVNCLFYVPGQQDAGVSSALDYLVAARQPILVSDCTMFDYARHGISIWPRIGLTDIYADYDFYLSRADRLYHELAGKIVTDTEAVFDRTLT